MPRDTDITAALQALHMAILLGDRRRIYRASCRLSDLSHAATGTAGATLPAPLCGSDG